MVRRWVYGQPGVRGMMRRRPIARALPLGWLLLALLLTLAVCGDGWVAHSQNMELPRRSFRDDQVMKVISTIDREDGAPGYHSSVVVHQGYMVEVYSNGSTHPAGGFAFYDIYNPGEPRLIARKQDLIGLDEQHAIGFSNSYPGETVALLAESGVQFWDWSDIRSPRQLSYLKLEGVTSGYATGAWWLFWQAPYLYLSGASNGIFIIDASDPSNPFLVERGDGQPNPIPNSQTGGFRVGPIFAVGNLLVISSNEGAGYATLDISDPKNPVLTASILDGTPASYSSMVNGNRIYAAGTDNRLHGFEISDPSHIKRLDSTNMGGRGGYLTIQDGIAHVGASDHYAKVDVSDDQDFRLLGTASSGIRGRDEDFAVVLGNLVVVSDDHGNGSTLIPHQAEPDTFAPQVTMVSPAEGAIRQARTSRIGLTFSDRIDLRTVDNTTFIVRPLDGEALPGKYSSQTGIVNFTPDEPLEAAATYEIIVPANGIRDVSGNGTDRAFRATFSTGANLGSSLICEVRTAERGEVHRPAELTARLVKGGGRLTYTWDFGDGTPNSAPLSAGGTAHLFDAPGHYTVRATVSNGVDATACAGLQTIAHPIREGQAPTSSTILLDRSGTQVWNVNPDHDSVTAVDAVTLKKMFEAPVGRQPRTLAQAHDGTIWVVNEVDASISVLDGAGAQVATIG
ncbi:MAG: PKD domain-containing protein, partial [Caldilineaceae bacterium]|nr:PKD domain-containing protein [Caldilineaceae bacterium]